MTLLHLPPVLSILSLFTNPLYCKVLKIILFFPKSGTEIAISIAFMIHTNQRNSRDIKERRRFSRKAIDVSTRIVIQDVVTGEIKEEGYARIRDISPGGALISEIDLPSQGLPITPFQVALIIEEGVLKGIQMTCWVKRIFNGTTSLSCALQFEKISDKHRARLWNFVINPYSLINEMIPM